MTPRHRRQLGVLSLSVALLVPVFGAGPAFGTPIDDKRAEAARLAQKIDALGEKVSALDEQYNDARLRLADAETKVNASAAKAAATAQRLDTLRAKARSEAVAAYVSGGNVSQAVGLVGANSSNDLFLRKQYLATAMGDDRQAIDGLKAAREDLAVERADLEKNRAAARSTADQVRAARTEAAKTMSQQEALLSSVKGDLDKLVKAEQARQAAAAAAKAEALIKARERAALTPPPRGGRLRTPLLDNPFGFDAPPPSHGADAAVAYARAQIGKPYQWAGSGEATFDCSGLTMRAWQTGGVSLSHSAAAQYSETTHVPLSSLQPGDLLFFGSNIHHVGLYVGGGQMIEAPHSGALVRYASMYRSDLIGAGRPG